MKVTQVNNGGQLIINNITIENALNIESVKCGTVPIYERIYKRSYDGSSLSRGRFKILHGIDSVQGEWPWIVGIIQFNNHYSLIYKSFPSYKSNMYIQIMFHQAGSYTRVPRL